MLDSQSCVDARLRKELAVAGTIGRGKSKGARLVQELLRLHGINVAIDGDLGAATETGLAKFCSLQGIAPSKTVDQAMMDLLAQPLLRVAAPASKVGTFGATVVATAKRHLAEHPIEIGGQNSGPWVRLYMDGMQGNAYPWCAGFVTYVLRQAATAHGVKSPVGRTYSCDVIGMEAKGKGKLTRAASPANAPAGSVFLVPHPGNKNDWVHTGLIIDPDGAGNREVFVTIEGNTNDEGSREGFEVCERIRACSKVDLVLLA
jgi:hypothetical protein